MIVFAFFVIYKIDLNKISFDGEVPGELVLENDEHINLNYSDTNAYPFMVTKGNINTYYAHLITAVGQLNTHGAKLTIRRSVTINTYSSHIIGKKGLQNIVIDLNGFDVQINYNGVFLNVHGHNTSIISSRPGGRIWNRSTESSAKAIQLTGAVEDWTPRLTIGENVTVRSIGGGAIYNHGGILVIDGATITSDKFYAIQTSWLRDDRNRSQLIIQNDKSKVYGIFGGNLAQTSWTGLIRITGGYIYPAPNTNKSIHLGFKGIELAVSGGYVQEGNINEYSTNTLSDIYGPIYDHESLGIKWYRFTQFRVVSYVANGGVSASTGKAPTSQRHYWDGKTFNLPNDMEYKASQGIKFDGWYTNPNNIDPVFEREANHSSNGTYYASYSYNVNLNPNDDNNTRAILSNGSFATTQQVKFQAGLNITNNLEAANFTRPGYEFLGWSLDKTAIKGSSSIYKVGSKHNFDELVSNGKLELYAIWDPIEDGTTYQVHYYFQNLDGTYYNQVQDNALVKATVATITNPFLKEIANYEISNLEDHISARNIIVKGDGTTVVKLYYNLVKHQVVFDFDEKIRSIINLEELKTFYGEENVIFDDSSSTDKLIIFATHGIKGISPNYLRYENGKSYDRWDKGFNVITEDLTIKALYKNNSYVYNFNYNNANNDSDTLNQVFNESFRLPKNISYPGFIFVGWHTMVNDELILFDTNLPIEVGNKTLEGVWKRGIPSNLIKLESLTNNYASFTKYSNYEYQLVEVNELLTDDWQDSPIFYDLLEKTEYQLYVRTKGIDKFRLPSDYIVSGSPVLTYSKEEMNIEIKKSDDNILIISPKPGIDYALKKDGEIIEPKIDEDGNYIFEGLNPDTEYEIVYKPSDEENYRDFDFDVVDEDGNKEDVKTKITGGIFDEDVLITNISRVDEIVSMTTNKFGNEYEYRISNEGPWIKVNLDGLLTFDNLDKKQSYELYVRTPESKTHSAGVPKELSAAAGEIKADGVDPKFNELTHLINSNGTIQAKTGFNYYDAANNLVNPINGFLDLNVVEKMTRKETGIFNESALIKINKQNRPIINEDDYSFTYEINENTITLDTNDTSEFRYFLKDELGNKVYGNVIGNKVFFDNLLYAENYQVYIIQNIGGIDSNETNTNTTIYINKEVIEINESSELAPEINYTVTYDVNLDKFVITLKTVLGVDYKDNNTSNWIKGNGNDYIFEVEPNTNFTLDYRINEQRVISNSLSFDIYIGKVPSEFVNVIDSPEVSGITTDIEVGLTENLLSGYSYAIAFDNNIPSRNQFIDYLGNEIIFLESLNELIKYKTKYYIYAIRLETNREEESQMKIVGTLETKKQATIRVPMPGSDLVNDILNNISYNHSLIDIKAYSQIQYKIVKISRVNGEIIEEVVWDFSNSHYLDNINVGDIYQIYIKLIENDLQEESLSLLINEITITKSQQHLDEFNLNVILVTHNSIIFEMNSIYEYSIDGINYISGYNGTYIFNNLDPNQAYQIYVKLKETNTHFESNSIIASEVTTLKVPTPLVDLPKDITYSVIENSISISSVIGISYSIDGINFILGTGDLIVFDDLNPGTLYQILYKYNETNTHLESNLVKELITTWHEVPTYENSIIDKVVTDTTIIFNPNNNYLYSLDNIEFFDAESFKAHLEVTIFDENTMVNIYVKRFIEDETKEFQIKTFTKLVIDNDDLNVDYVTTYNSIKVVYTMGYNYELHLNGKTITGQLVGNYFVFSNLDYATKYDIYIQKLGSSADETVSSNFKFAKTAITNKLPTEFVDRLNPEELNLGTASINVTDNKVIISGKEGLEYSIDGITWFKGTIVYDYNSDNELNYILDNILVRREETLKEEHSYAEKITTKIEMIEVAIPDGDQREIFNLSSTDKKIVFTGLDLYEYSVDGINFYSVNSNMEVHIPNLDPHTEYQILIRRKITNSELYSQSVSATYNGMDAVITTKKTLIEITYIATVLDLTPNMVEFSADNNYKYYLAINGTIINADDFTLSAVFNYDNSYIYNLYVIYEDETSYSNITLVEDISKYSQFSTELTLNDGSQIILDNPFGIEYSLIDINQNIVTSSSNIFNVLPNMTYYILGNSNNQFIVDFQFEVTVRTMIDNEILHLNEFTTDKLAGVISDDDKYVIVMVNSQGQNTIVVKDGFEYSKDYLNFTSNSFEIDSNDIVYIRTIETNTHYNSSSHVANQLKQQELPTNLVYEVIETKFDQAKIKVKSDQTLEYSIDGINYFDATDDILIFTNLNPRTLYNVYVRTKKTLEAAESKDIMLGIFFTSIFDHAYSEFENFILDQSLNLDDFKELITNASETIKEMDDLAAIYEYIEEVKLQIIKDNANKVLNYFINNINDETAKNLVSDLINDSLVTINDLNNIDSINELLNDTLTEAQDILDKYYFELYKKQKLDELLDEFNSYDENDYLADDYEKLVNAYNNAKDFIKEATTKDEIDNAFNTGIKEMCEVLTYQNRLDEAKEFKKNELDNLLNEYNKNNYTTNGFKELEDIINSAKDELDKLSTIEEVLNYDLDLIKDQLNNVENIDEEVLSKKEELLDKFLDDLNKDDFSEDNWNLINDILNDKINNINKDNIQDSKYLKDLENSIKNEIDNIIRNQNKENFDDVFNELTDNALSKETIEEIKREFEDKINDATSKEEFDEILDQVVKEFEKQKQIDTIKEEITDLYKELIKNDSYGIKGKDELDSIFEEFNNQFNKINSRDEKLDYLDFVSKKLNNVKVFNLSTNKGINPNEEYDESDLVDQLYGFLESTSGLDKNIKLKTVIKEMNNIKLVNNLIKKGKIISADNKDSKTLLKTLKKQKIFALLDIYLVNGEVVVSEFDGKYTVSLLLPKSLNEFKNLRILYNTGEVLEVFEVTENGNWITFETTHFSEFYIIGDPLTKDTNLWWVIITLIVIIIVEVVVIVLKTNNKNTIKTNSFIFPLFALVPSLSIPIIIILGITALVLLAVIIYLYFIKNKNDAYFDESDDYIEIEKEAIIKPVIAPVITENKTLYNYSFKARLHLADKETIKRYNEIKNYILSFNEFKLSESWGQETYLFNGKSAIKIRVNGKTLSLFFDLNLIDFNDSKYVFDDRSNVKAHALTPLQYKINGPRKQIWALELIDIYVLNNNGTKNLDYINKDYLVSNMSVDELISLKLIKISNVNNEYAKIINIE